MPGDFMMAPLGVRGNILNVVPWEYIELRDEVVDRPVACAFTGDPEQKVKPAACWLPHPPTYLLPCRS